ncbi:MAG: hypothetical protein Q9184_008560, partial [Pyrenodesmia sp. 2 TL-2023]
ITEFGDLRRLEELNPEEFVECIIDRQMNVCEAIVGRISRYAQEGLLLNSLYLREQLHSLQTSAFRRSPSADPAEWDKESSETLALIHIDHGNFFAAEQILADCLIFAKQTRDDLHHDPLDNDDFDDFLSRITDKLTDLCALLKERIKHLEWEKAEIQGAWEMESDAVASELIVDLAARVDIDTFSTRLHGSGLIEAKTCKQALWFAAKYNACNLARLFLDQGVDINATTPDH